MFDLFGTLVRNYSNVAYEQVIARMAEALAADASLLSTRLGQAYRDREIGLVDSIEASFAAACRDLGLAGATPECIERAARHHYEYAATVVAPEPGVVEALVELRARGFRIGLVSNCGPDIPRLWPDLPLTPLIDASLFSCLERLRKPDPRIYALCAERLGVAPAECLYVGDGSDGELSGAAAAGMHPVLKRTDLSDVYDAEREDVRSWRGPEVGSILEVVRLVDRERS